jgi:hypothetical protein
VGGTISLINVPNKTPFELVRDLGIAIRTIPGPAQQIHIGLLHKVEDGRPYILNLRHFSDLRNDDPSDSYRWVQVDLDDVNRRLVVALCRLLAKKLPSIPFGFTFNRNYFSQAGDYILGEFGDGLTCATFVMAVFATYNIPLLKIQEWATSREDQLWQYGQVGQVQVTRGPFVAEAIARHIGAPRYRPEHVTAAAAISTNRSLGFKEAEKLGKRIVRDLIATYH